MKQKYLLLIFLAALFLRLSILFLGYHGDLNNQISWGTIALQGGLNGFYEGTTLDKVHTVFENAIPRNIEEAPLWTYSIPNQPPLTILLLAAMAGLWQIIYSVAMCLNNNFGFFPSVFIWFWEQKGMVLLMKLPGVLADLGIGVLIYKYFSNKQKAINNKQETALLITTMWLFNPIVWYNSSIWGQTDSIVNLLGLLSVFALLNKNLRWSVFWFTLSVLFKGSLLYFVPILLVVALIQKYPIKQFLHATCYLILATFAVSIWFHPFLDLPLWLFNLYTKTFIPGEIGYLTANAFNFWYLVDPGKTYDSIIYFGLPARIWGFIPVALVMIWQIWNLRKGVTDKRVFFALAITAVTVFIFMTRIHERYLYPFFPYATLLLGFVPMMWFIYIPLSLIHLLNLYNLFWVPSIPMLEQLMKKEPFLSILSILTIFLYVIFYLLSKTSSKRVLE